jgi:hypothetical protein
MRSTIGQHDVYLYLRRHGWTPIEVMAAQLDVDSEDLWEEIRDMEYQDLVVINSDGEINIPLESRGPLAKFWAKWFGY